MSCAWQKKECGLLAWYENQDEALQTRIRMLACFTADLQGGDWGQLLPGACSGARDDRAIFDATVDMLIAPLLSERMQKEVRRSLADVSAPGKLCSVATSRVWQ